MIKIKSQEMKKSTPCWPFWQIILSLTQFEKFTTWKYMWLCKKHTEAAAGRKAAYVTASSDGVYQVWGTDDKKANLSLPFCAEMAVEHMGETKNKWI